jgi:ssDNA-binding Zn-finger/Zn-ribbon topoisomerase 1
MKGKAMRQTKCIDDIKCPYCGYMFNGSDAVNGDMDCTEATCPKCEKEMAISISVEYLATEIEN